MTLFERSLQSPREPKLANVHDRSPEVTERRPATAPRPKPADTAQRGQVTLTHLLMLIAVFIPVEAVIVEIKHLRGGPVHYALGIPLALGLGAVIGRVNWILGRSLWLRSQRYSSKVQNTIAIGVFALDIVWILVGCLAGNALAHFIYVIKE